MSAELGLAHERMAAYRATVCQRWEQEQRELERRKGRAWEVARHAAKLLKERFGAAQVVIFGSLVHGYWFSRWSDIDLAAWGLQLEDYFLAVAKLQDLEPEFEIDLVSVEYCRPALRESIMREGKPL